MYGKHFDSMYTGSMVGCGAMVFAVMGYIISKMKPDATVGMQVELNPKLLALILGEKESDVVSAIEFLCQPDKQSRSPDKEGRRLVRLGQFDYQVVNGAAYDRIRNERDRREYNRLAKQKERARKKGKPLTGESEAIAAENRGDYDVATIITKNHERAIAEKLGRDELKEEPVEYKV